jgi:hypothetical protein
MVEGSRQPQGVEKPQSTPLMPALEREVGKSIRDYALKADGRKVASVKLDRDNLYTKLEWPGQIDFRVINKSINTLSHAVFGKALKLDENEENRKNVHVELITNERSQETKGTGGEKFQASSSKKITTGELSDPGIYKKYKRLMDNPLRPSPDVDSALLLSSVRLDIQDPNDPSKYFALVATNTEDRYIQRAKLTIEQVGDSQTWNENLTKWVFSKHVDAKKLHIDSAQATQTINRLINPNHNNQ